MKKKFLLILLLTLFVSMNNVYAFELPSDVVIANSCTKNLMKPAKWDKINFRSVNDLTLVARTDSNTYQNNNYVSEILIPVESGKKYYFSQKEELYSSSIHYKYLDKNFEYLNYDGYIMPKKTSMSNNLTIPENAVYLILYHRYSSSNAALLTNLQQTKLQIEVDAITDYLDYEECIIEEPEPEKPPVIEPLDGMEIVTNFYNVFLNNLTNFIKFVSSNYAMLSFLTTIVLFIAVELFFKFFRR